jgi:tetratricopeptide (TPR) repeat protein
LAAAQQAGSRRGMAVALDSVGCALTRLGRIDEARTVLTDALALYRELGNKSGEAMTLVDLAAVAMEEHDHAQATPLYVEALTLAWQIGDRRRVAFCLEGLGQTTVEDDAERATWYLSAAHELRCALSSPLPPSEQHHFDRTVAQIKATLSPAAFEAAWRLGADTPLDQIVAQVVGR